MSKALIYGCEIVRGEKTIKGTQSSGRNRVTPLLAGERQLIFAGTVHRYYDQGRSPREFNSFSLVRPKALVINHV